jgi:hypothetical protein
VSDHSAGFRGVDLNGVVMRGVELVNVDIYGQIENLTINGVDIAPLVNAELDRPCPDRAMMRPVDPAGFREAWNIVERLWSGTVERSSPATSPAARVRRRRVVVHRDASTPDLRHGLLDATGHPRRPVAVGSPGPALG